MQALISPAPGYALPRSHWVRKITPNHRAPWCPPSPPCSAKARHCYSHTLVFQTGQLAPNHSGPQQPAATPPDTCWLLCLVFCHSRWCPVDPHYDLPPTVVAITGVLGPLVIGGTSVATSVPTAALPGSHPSELMARPRRWPFGHSDSHYQQGCFLLQGGHYRACLMLISGPLCMRELCTPPQSLFPSHPGPMPPVLARSCLFYPEAGSSPWVPFFPSWGPNSGHLP